MAALKNLQFPGDTYQAISYAFMLAMLAGLAACTTIYEEAPAPVGTIATNFSPPAEGTKLAYRTFIGKNTVKQEDWVVITPAQNFKQPVYALKSGSRIVVRNRHNGNWIATFVGNEKIKGATPDDDQMRHPLWAGKKWLSAFVYNDYRANREWSPIQNFWSVEARETITVEAGTFDTFRLKSDPGLHSSTRSTVWFSPRLGVEIRRQWQRLEDHYLGSQKGRIELVHISPPAT